MEGMVTNRAVTDKRTFLAKIDRSAQANGRESSVHQLLCTVRHKTPCECEGMGFDFQGLATKTTGFKMPGSMMGDLNREEVESSLVDLVDRPAGTPSTYHRWRLK